MHGAAITLYVVISLLCCQEIVLNYWEISFFLHNKSSKLGSINIMALLMRMAVHPEPHRESVNYKAPIDWQVKISLLSCRLFITKYYYNVMVHLVIHSTCAFDVVLLHRVVCIVFMGDETCNKCLKVNLSPPYIGLCVCRFHLTNFEFIVLGFPPQSAFSPRRCVRIISSSFTS